MRKQKELFIDSFTTYTEYFLTCEKQWDSFDYEKCNIVFIKIFNSILFEENTDKRNQKMNLLDEDDWRTLLADCPQFADKCKEVGYEPQDLIDDTDDDCDEDGCDLEFFESEDGSGEIFVS